MPVVDGLEQVLDSAAPAEIELQPGKPVPGLGSGTGKARQRPRQRALAVLDADLRDGAEGELLHPLAGHGDGGDPGQDLGAKQPRQRVVRHDEREGAIGRVEQSPGDGNALLLVGVEQCRRARPDTTSASFHARL